MKKTVIVAIVGLMIFTGCFSPYQGEEGVITLSFGGGGAPPAAMKAAVWPDPDNGEEGALHLVEHRVTLSGPSGSQTRTVTGTTTAQFVVVPGVWQVTVEDLCYGLPFATGTSDPVEVKAGQSSAVSIKMEKSNIIFYAAGDADEFKQAIADSSDTAGAYDSMALVLTNSFSMDAYSGFDAYLPVPLTILGGGNTITLSSGGSLFTIDGAQPVTIKDVHLKGRGTSFTNNAALVYVDNGSFAMQSGSSVSGNHSNGAGGGVRIMNGGTFTMEGNARVFNNFSDSDGGGVNVNNSNFIMKGNAEVSGNYADQGGGVYTGGGTFTMESGSSVHSNQANKGGGVFAGGGNFYMNGGTVSGNHSLGSQGGGVLVAGSVFVMSGGTIYGAGEGGNSNKLSNPASGSGAALYVSAGTAIIGSRSPVEGPYAVDTTINVSGGVWVNPPAYDRTFTAGTNSEWQTAVSAISSDGNGKSYLINIPTGTTVSVAASAATFGTVATSITISGGGTLQLNTNNGSLLTIHANQTVSIVDVNLNGLSGNNNASLVNVNSGTFIMNDNSLISGHTNNQTPNGGGVYVTNGGTFIMNGGKISQNKGQSSHAGGVCADNNGTFIMNGGTITLNTASYGGGVSVKANGIFFMNGGVITGNTSDGGWGGGVNVAANGTFRLITGIIVGNTAYPPGTTDYQPNGLVGGTGAALYNAGTATYGTAASDGTNGGSITGGVSSVENTIHVEGGVAKSSWL